jgi:adenine-specific DNA-methyltransferase
MAPWVKPKNTEVEEERTMSIQKIEPGMPESQSADILADNLARLKALFPELVTEGARGPAINIDVLKALVGDTTVTGAEEKYGLNWHGKRAARQLALTPSTGTLRPCPQESVDWETTQNLMIEGDNLEVLKLLQKSYAGKVKLIYIDPPYNTGNDFVYPDNFEDNLQNYLELTGQAEGGRKVTSNTEAGGRFHTHWLNMIHPRLMLARNLLRPDGLIFISIGQREIHHLVSVCDEIFGEENKIGIVGRSMKTGGNSGKFFSPNLEFILAYGRTLDEANGFKTRLSDALKEAVYNQVQESGPRAGQAYRTMGLYQASLTLGRSKNARYFIGCPDGSKCIPPEGKRWRVVEPSFLDMKVAEDIVFKQTGTSPLLDEYGNQSKWNVYTKIWLSTREEEGQIPVDILTKYENRHSAKELNELGVPFPFAKPTGLVRHLLEISQTGGDDLILDFFAGSGTTGHAVMAQNAADGAQRRFILIQLPEALDAQDEEHKPSIEVCRASGRPANLVELAKERLARSATKVRSENPEWDGNTGFRTLKLAHSSIRPWVANTSDVAASLLNQLDHVHQGRNSDDILHELLLKLGLDLCVSVLVQTIAGKTVQAVGGGVLITCLEKVITVDEAEPLALGVVAWREQLAPAGDVTCVFLDSAFENDVAKTNLAAILEQHGITKVRSL